MQDPSSRTAPMTERDPPPSNDVVAGRFELTRHIARGGMGEVFAARDRSTGKMVALKRLQASACAQRGILAHFMREYRSLSELRHPRIIEVFDYGVDRELPYYTMELLDGQDLRDLSPLPYREACMHLRDVASSLALLHARRLLHRDVSPRNVRRTSDGRCKLIDFGAMIPFGVAPNVAGTPPCVPPEALQGAALDQRSDLYSLGALAYYLLTGRFGREVTQLKDLPDAWAQRLRHPQQLVHDVPDALDALVVSLLSIDPARRPKSAAEVIERLSAIAQLAPDDAVAAARSFMTNSLLCGRERETAELSKRLQRTVAGRGCTLMLEGPVGCGKSRLLSEAALLAQTYGLVVVRAVARPQRGPGRPLASDLIAGLLQIAPLEAEAAGAAKIEWANGKALDGATHAHGGTELRTELQHALHEVFCSVARARPLLVAVDDVDQADELSIALLGSLALRADHLPLMLVCSRAAERAERGFDASLVLHSVAKPLALDDLKPGDCRLLLESIFGNAPNIALLSDWMYRIGRGNPQLTIELVEHLTERGLVRYVDGAWILPGYEIGEELPHDLAHAWTLRMQDLSAEAERMAELLCVRRGGASAELCLAASAELVSDAFGALYELVQRRILESAGDDYVFATAGLRRALHERLDEQRRRQLHGRWAEALLSSATDDNLAVQLEAGFHLVRSAEPVRGAELVARVAPLLVERGLAMETAIPAMENAIAIFEAHGGSLETRLSLRSALVLAGYLFDYKLAVRYGADTVTALHRASGVRLAARLRWFVGAPLAMALAFAVTWLQRLVTPRSRRAPPVYMGLTYFVRTAMGLLGVNALQLDAEATTKILRLVTPLGAALPFTSGRLVYLACRAFAAQIQGHEGELHARLPAALAEIRRGRRFDMTAHEYEQLLIALLVADGMHESWRESSKALERAEQLAAIGGRLAEAAAERIRLNYQMRRGDFERAEQHRRQLGLLAIQHGTSWQVEWFALPAEVMFGVRWCDPLMARRALDRLERLAGDIPGLAPHALSARIGYHFMRAEYARAVEYGERYAALHPPGTLIGWTWAYAMFAFSWLELGQHQRALELTQRAFAVLTLEDRASYVFASPLEIAHATALALHGDKAPAYALVQQRLDRVRALGEDAELAGMYQDVVRMAHLTNDREQLVRSLAEMREAALRSGVSTVILLADRLAESYAPKHDSIPSAKALEADYTSSHEPLTASAAAQPATALSTFFMRRAPGAARSQEALRLLARSMASDEAYLYLPDPHGLQLAAAIGGEELPEELLGSVERALRTRREGPLQAHMLAVTARAPLAANSNGQDARHYRILPLPGASETGWIAAVVLRDHGHGDAALPSALIEDVGRLVTARAERS